MAIILASAPQSHIHALAGEVGFRVKALKRDFFLNAVALKILCGERLGQYSPRMARTQRLWFVMATAPPRIRKADSGGRPGVSQRESPAMGTYRP